MHNFHRNKACVRLCLMAMAFAVSSCASGKTEAELEGDSVIEQTSEVPHVMVELSDRHKEYENVFREARRQGLVAGALRGALVGALVSGEGAGAAAGAFLGAIIGSNHSVLVAERLLNDRQEFMNRQAIVDNVLSAARIAAEKTERDAQLVASVSEKFSKYDQMPDPATRLRFSLATEYVSRAAELRALVIEESLQEAKLPSNQSQEVGELLARQLNALSHIREMQGNWGVKSDE
jgi:uncharacterized membrane protein